MVLKQDQERVKTLLRDTITLLCKNGLAFRNKFCIEATIGVTLDEDDVFLVSMNEIVNSDKPKPPSNLPSETESIESRDGQLSRKRKRMRNKIKQEGENSAEEILDSSEEDYSVTNSSRFNSSHLPEQAPERAPDNSRPVIEIKEEVHDVSWIGDETNEGQSLGDYPVPGTFGQSEGPDGSVVGDMVQGNLVPDNSQWMQQLSNLNHGAGTSLDPGGTSQSFNDSLNPSEMSQQGELRFRYRQTYGCHVCDKMFTTKPILARHLQSHAGRYTYKCDVCGKGYTSAANLRGHKLSVHSGVREFRCQYCTKEFSYKANLKVHISKKHFEETLSTLPGVGEQPFT